MRSVWIDLFSLDLTFKCQDGVDRVESISEGKDTNNEDDHEDFHIAQTCDDHSHDPTKDRDDTQFDQESVPNEKGNPGLNGPELSVFVIFIKDVEEEEEYSDRIDNLDKLSEVEQWTSDEGGNLHSNQVQTAQEDDDWASLLLVIYCVFVFFINLSSSCKRKNSSLFCRCLCMKWRKDILRAPATVL